MKFNIYSLLFVFLLCSTEIITLSSSIKSHRSKFHSKNLHSNRNQNKHQNGSDCVSEGPASLETFDFFAFFIKVAKTVTTNLTSALVDTFKSATKTLHPDLDTCKAKLKEQYSKILGALETEGKAKILMSKDRSAVLSEA